MLPVSIGLNRQRHGRNILKSMKLWLLVIGGMLLVVLFFLSSVTRPVFETLQSSYRSTRPMPTLPNDVIKKWYNYTEDNALNGEGVAMDDPRVVRKLIKNFLVPPPKVGPSHVYNLAKPEIIDTSMGQSEKIRNILHNRTNGFFIECGALDGETRSNTLYMEKYLNWSGLLIEADPLNFAQMVEKNRKTWLSPTCLSKTSYPQIVSFKQDFNIGRISEKKTHERHPGYADVQCFPIYSYMLALNVTHVDYFSLDVEGDELDVLMTLPFDKVNIETLSVEFAHVDKGKDKLQDFMESKGYLMVAEVTHPDWLANDFIFVKNTVR